MKKVIKIGCDLDGVIIGKPPLMSKKLLERLFKGGCGKGLHYRFPKNKLEQRIRILSHFWLIRPAIKKNVIAIKKLVKNKNVRIYAVSSRYSFLKKRTEQWFAKRKLNNLFEKFYLNIDDEQPHIFKEKMIKKLKLDYFLDDDPAIVKYLKRKVKKTEIVWVENNKCFKKLQFQNKI